MFCDYGRHVQSMQTPRQFQLRILIYTDGINENSSGTETITVRISHSMGTIVNSKKYLDWKKYQIAI